MDKDISSEPAKVKSSHNPNQKSSKDSLENLVVSVFDAPVTNTSKFRDITWPDFYDLLTGDPVKLNADPADEKKFTEEKSKQGEYFVRGRIDGTRNDDDLAECSQLVIDVDKPLRKKPLPKPAEFHKRLKDTGIAYAVHSSAHHERCRLVFPVEPYDKSETTQKTWEAYCWLNEVGLEFEFAGESKTKSQPWFLPQTTDPEKHQAFGVKDGEFFTKDLLQIDIPYTPEPPAADPPGQATEPIKTLFNAGWFLDQIINKDTLHEAAKSHAGWLKRISDLSIKQIFDDITDMVERFATQEKRDRWHQRERSDFEKWFKKEFDKPAGEKGGAMPLVKFSEMKTEPLEWIIDGYIPEQSLGVIFGQPDTYKSFMTIDQACCIGTGIDYCGKKVKQAPVVYICGEGEAGIRQRIQVWCNTHGIKKEDLPVYVSTVPPALSAPGNEQVEWVSAAIDTMPAPPGLIVLDTLQRNFGPGNESDAKDMSRFVAACDELRRRYKCSVSVIHHSGQNNQEREMGSIKLRASVDIMYKASVDAKKTIRLECLKIKDAEKPPGLAFRSRIVELSELNSKGKPATSLILNNVPYVHSATEANQTAADKALAGLLALQRQRKSTAVIYNNIDPRVKNKHWREHMEDTVGMSKSTFDKTLRKLLAENKALHVGGFYFHQEETPENYPPAFR